MTTPRILGGTPSRQEFAFDGTLAVSYGDLMYYTGDDVKPASSQADLLTEAANQALFARNFVGLAIDGKLVTDTAADTDFQVLTEAEAEFDCASGTCEVGDLFAVDEASSGTALENAKLVKVTNPDLAIAVATERITSAATRVKVRFLPRRTTPYTTPPMQIADVDQGTEVTIAATSPRYVRITPSASIDVLLPAFTATPAGELWTVENDSDTTSDFVLTLKTSADAATGLTVAEGARRTVYHNGTVWLALN